MTKIIDYSNNLNPRTGSPQNYAEMAKLYGGLKKLALDKNVTIITGKQKITSQPQFTARDIK
jgi:hypothetical protein